MVEEPTEFEELDEDGNKTPSVATNTDAPTRTRLPRPGQYAGTVTQRLGGNRMDILCSDGKTRNCRVPGRFRRSMWLRVKDIVLIETWEHDSEKGDIIYKYNPSEVNQLKKRGLLTDNKNEF